jgi:hypothetical protein
MNIFLIIYILKAEECRKELQRGYYTFSVLATFQKLMEVDQELHRGYMNRFLISYVLKA